MDLDGLGGGDDAGLFDDDGGGDVGVGDAVGGGEAGGVAVLDASAAATSGGKGKAVDPSQRVTTRYMTKYERARLLGTRALQLRCVEVQRASIPLPLSAAALPASRARTRVCAHVRAPPARPHTHSAASKFTG